MTQPNLAEPYDPEAVSNYRQESRLFLAKAQGYLDAGKLHRASENGWDAAVSMAKAVAAVHGWRYQEHAEFGVVLINASDLTGNDRLLDLKSVAYSLHLNHYTRKRFLSHHPIAHDLDRVAELLDLLEPLTPPANHGQTGG